MTALNTASVQAASISRSKAIKWIIATALTALAVSLLSANGYIALWYMKVDAAGTPHNAPPPVAVVQRGVVLTAGVGLCFTLGLWWWLHRKREPFATLFGTRTQAFGKDAGLGLLLGLGWVLVYGAISWPPFSAMFVFNQAKLLSLPASFSAGFCEEFLFRGFVILLIARAGGGAKAQVLWSSLAFGLAHVFWGPVGMVFTVALGACFAAVTLWRGNVWAAAVAHTVLDLCIEPGLIEKAMSFTHK